MRKRRCGKAWRVCPRFETQRWEAIETENAVFSVFSLFNKKDPLILPPTSQIMEPHHSHVNLGMRICPS